MMRIKSLETLQGIVNNLLFSVFEGIKYFDEDHLAYTSSIQVFLLLRENVVVKRVLLNLAKNNKYTSYDDYV